MKFLTTHVPGSMGVFAWFEPVFVPAAVITAPVSGSQSKVVFSVALPAKYLPQTPSFISLLAASELIAHVKASVDFFAVSKSAVAVFGLPKSLSMLSAIDFMTPPCVPMAPITMRTKMMTRINESGDFIISLLWLFLMFKLLYLFGINKGNGAKRRARCGLRGLRRFNVNKPPQSNNNYETEGLRAGTAVGVHDTDNGHHSAYHNRAAGGEIHRVHMKGLKAPITSFLERMEKGQTGDMFFWFMVMIVGALTVVIIALFVSRVSQSLDKPAGESIIQNAMPLFFWVFFKLGKQR
jgi:hypothetical protein